MGILRGGVLETHTSALLGIFIKNSLSKRGTP